MKTETQERLEDVYFKAQNYNNPYNQIKALNYFIYETASSDLPQCLKDRFINSAKTDMAKIKGVLDIMLDDESYKQN